MSYITVAGHITQDATQRTVNTPNGVRTVTTFTVADNSNPNKPEFFRFSAWSAGANKLVNLAKKGRAVTCNGNNIRASAYIDRNGKAAASLDLTLSGITWQDARPVEAPVAQAVTQGTAAVEAVIPDTVIVEEPVLPF